MSPHPLPLPRLERREVGERPQDLLVMHTDDGLFASAGIRIGFTERGPIADSPFSGLNLSATVGGDEGAARAAIRRLCAVVGATEDRTIRPRQVHGTHLVTASSEASLPDAMDGAAEGADGVVVTAPDVAALLCFADCAPVIIASPSGSFAVAHAGWRGAVAGIAGGAARALAAQDAARGAFPSAEAAAQACNAYIGPCIHGECFEVGPDVRDRFVERFGRACAPDQAHVDLVRAVRVDLNRAGIPSERIAVLDACTACEPDRFFSYRACGGTCGRHGAIACRPTEGGEL